MKKEINNFLDNNTDFYLTGDYYSILEKNNINKAILANILADIYSIIYDDMRVNYSGLDNPSDLLDITLDINDIYNGVETVTTNIIENRKDFLEDISLERMALYGVLLMLTWEVYNYNIK